MFRNPAHLSQSIDHLLYSQVRRICVMVKCVKLL